MFYTTVEIIALVVMIFVIAYSWYYNEKSVWKSLLYTVLVCGIFYLNIPNFLSIVDGTQPKYTFFSVPFMLYDTWGTLYIIITNLLLTLVGLYLGQNKNNRYSSKKTKTQFDDFISNATQLKIIGRDLDFLLNNGSNQYYAQREKIISLRNHAKALCAWTEDKKLISLYHDLLKNGIQVRAYTSRDGIANLKGQIKIDEQNGKSGLFVLKLPQSTKQFHMYGRSNLFEITGVKNGYLLEAVDQQFDKTFANSLHPVIRCIALDLGGVYFDGDIDEFYKYLREEFGIAIKKRGKDRLNIDDNLMLGNITIRDFIEQRAFQKEKIKNLQEDDWEKIVSKWQDNWHPNEQIKSIIMELGNLGYTVIPFSNLDKQNGEKYIREHYLPECCPAYYFSYERQKAKPNKRAFQDFTAFAQKRGFIQEPYQILLIDDEIKNLETAAEQGWETIQFYNDPLINNATELAQKLKNANILPEEYLLE